MAHERLSMRKTKEILRLKYELKLSQRQISQSCQVSPSTVWDCLSRFKASGLIWPLPEGMNDQQLEERLYNAISPIKLRGREGPNWQVVNKELRKKHVTLMLLWQEYKACHPDGYQYSWFCHEYARYHEQLDLVMRQEYKLGEKCFVDYAGDTMPVVDPQTGEVEEVYIFIGVLGASNYTYIEASRAQDLPSWIASHVRMFEYFGGVPEQVIPDNLKCGVSRANYYEPDLNPIYQEMAEHYGVAILPARVRRPRDKAKVENGVFLAERWVMAALRHRTFFSLGELQTAIKEQLEKLNQRTFQKLPGSRASIFEEEERRTLQPLASRRYEYREHKRAKVHIDYHVELEGHYYSVPYTLVRKPVDIRWTPSVVEIFYKGERVASHLRSYIAGKATTLLEHRPPPHRHQAEWTAERVVAWASKTGEWTAKLVEGMMARRAHPEQAFRSSLGVMRLADTYGRDRLEAACRRAIHCESYAYKTVKAILENKLDQQPWVIPIAKDSGSPTHHENIRGADYYH